MESMAELAEAADMSCRVNELLRANGERPRYLHEGVLFASKLEIAWWDLLRAHKPDCPLIYEPGTLWPLAAGGRVSKERRYTPDFVMMPPGWRHPGGSNARYFREVLDRGAFFEVKPDTADEVTNCLDLVRKHVVLLKGHPEQGGAAWVVRTWGLQDRTRWEAVRRATVGEAVSEAVEAGHHFRRGDGTYRGLSRLAMKGWKPE